ncbi:hypothetical protein GCM10010320_25560 [Streptomyces caelestis]|nr:hypothetical protein GCM10010320_25560 [Streptomyces caelestis]
MEAELLGACPDRTAALLPAAVGEDHGAQTQTHGIEPKGGLWVAPVFHVKHHRERFVLPRRSARPGKAQVPRRYGSGEPRRRGSDAGET